MAKRKSELVKERYSDPVRYQKHDYNVRLRAEIVRQFVAGRQFKNMVDIPCGTGGIAAAVISQCEQATLVDFSSGMIELAQKNVREENITFINKDVFDCELAKGSYDLAMALGILAHIDDPQRFLQLVADLVEPGGTLIIQNTDAGQFKAQLLHAYFDMQATVNPKAYKHNRITNQALFEFLEPKGFVLKDQFSYGQVFPLSLALKKGEHKYEAIKHYYSNGMNRKGSEYIFLFEKNGN